MQKEIGVIQKGKQSQLKIRLTEFKNHNLLDIRDFFKSKVAIDYGPTRRGVTLDMTKIPEIISLLELAEAESLKK